MFNNPSHKCIIVKYSLCLPCKSLVFVFLFALIASHPDFYKMHKVCFTELYFSFFSLEEEKLCLEKEYQEQPTQTVSIVGP